MSGLPRNGVSSDRRGLGAPPASSAFDMGQHGEQNANMLPCSAVPVRACVVSYKGSRGVTHSTEVEAESLYEAVVFALLRFRRDPWLEPIGPGTPLTIKVREPATSHSVTMQQVEQWLASVNKTPGEAGKKAKLKTMLLRGH